jgi:type IV pilus assembly protein PilM
VNIVDIDSIALINAFNFGYAQDENLKHKAVALLNIGATTTNLDIWEAGLPRLCRDVHIAGNNFTQKIADIFGVDFKAAEDLKLNPTADKSNKISAVLDAVLTNLAGEIRTSFDYYESQSASSVAKIFLSGGGSKFIGLKDALANLLGIEVEVWDPLKQINLPDKADLNKVKELSPQLAVAVGLALR